MGLTNKSTGIMASNTKLVIKKNNESDKIVALAGNPNVGKSTVFNNLTGMNQHTGNWPGKTVTNAQGYCSFEGKGYVLVDIPGTYSLMAHSAEEEVARNLICFGQPDAVIVVCDATCLERNMNLVLQTLEITDKVIVCINLMDEAEKKNIEIDIKGLSKQLGIPVVGTTARNKTGLEELLKSVESIFENKFSPFRVKYTEDIETAISIIEPSVKELCCGRIDSRWLSLRLLDSDSKLMDEVNSYLDTDIMEYGSIKESIKNAREYLSTLNLTAEDIKTKIVSCLVITAEGLCLDTVSFNRDSYNKRDRKIDRILTSKRTGIPIMLLALICIFWLTITGANYPSELISTALFWIEEKLVNFAVYIGVPQFVYEMLIYGVYRVVAWIVAVMLPPMAIFFPIFTLLEDSGYLPRIAFNLDKYFKKCDACGKQALTMCMVNNWIKTDKFIL